LRKFQETQSLTIENGSQSLLDAYQNSLKKVSDALAEEADKRQGQATSDILSGVNRRAVKFGEVTRPIWSAFEKHLDSLAEEIDGLSKLYGRNYAIGEVDRALIKTLKGLWPEVRNGRLIPGTGAAGRFYDLSAYHRQELANSVTRNVLGAADRRTIIRDLGQTLKRTESQASQLFHDASIQFARTIQLEKAKEQGFEYFVSMGPRDGITRRFCGVVLNLIWSRPEIERMRNGQDSGSVFITHGGYNCRHHWQAVERDWFSDDEWNSQRGVWVDSLGSE